MISDTEQRCHDVQQLLTERHAKEGEVRRLHEELAASKQREEAKVQQVTSLQNLARQIDRRSKAAEVARADAEVKLRQAQEQLLMAKRAAKKAKEESSRWKCRYATARMERGQADTEAAQAEATGGSTSR